MTVNPFNPYTQYSQYTEFSEMLKADVNDPLEREKLVQPALRHESAGIIRMHRNGMSHAQIRKVLALQPQQLIQEIRIGLDDETVAQSFGQQIVDSGIRRGTK